MVEEIRSEFGKDMLVKSDSELYLEGEIFNFILYFNDNITFKT